MTKILDWRRSDDPRDVVHLAVQALVEGHVVAVPTDHCYLLVASGLQAGAVEQLSSASKGADVGGLSVIPRSADESLDLIPSISPASRRLVRKAWPGPLVLQTPNAHDFSSLRCLPEPVYQRLQTLRGEVRLWLPKHEVLHYLSRLVSGPLLTSLAPALDPARTIVTAVAGLAPGTSVLAIDAGEVEMPGGPTVVAIDGNCGQVLQDGIVDRATLEQLSQMDILFVCTGNTCRSPMAAALMQRKIREKFGDTYRGHAVPIRTHSAGVSAFGGDPASHGARQAMRGFGLRLDEHQSAQLNASMVDQADLILVMGQRHRNVIVSQWPEAASKVHLMASDGGEISDPFGGPLEVYQRCAEQLERHTNAWIQRIDKSSLIEWT